MAHVLIVHDSETIRAEVARELMAEGFTVSEADSTSAAVREIWQGTYAAVLIGDRLPGVNGTSLEEHLKGIAPEIVTLPLGSKGNPGIARKLADILDGAVAA